MKFFKCSHCGQIVTKLIDKNVPIICCGEPMKEIIPGTVEADQEKHIPLILKTKNKVNIKIGEKPHPMLPAHHIEWVSLKTKNGCFRKEIASEKEATVTFYLDDNDEIVSVYAYCNLHGLWKKEGK